MRLALEVLIRLSINDFDYGSNTHDFDKLWVFWYSQAVFLEICLENGLIFEDFLMFLGINGWNCGVYTQRIIEIKDVKPKDSVFIAPSTKKSKTSTKKSKTILTNEQIRIIV